ncbi:hypothetical protein [Endozoicomonas euniceicola]|uniref:Uncharacterized protein n=1 Tax=Endozoicomonas euniceicola TaxID=1234143 RepID=A0ABY6GPV6_9GAMM|nr:hypothetical protein [Endozoicomonas euniceicola]UYM14730.1 hypothetical protein NX720_17800 [Endozoicomonas euniceicola]
MKPLLLTFYLLILPSLPFHAFARVCEDFDSKSNKEKIHTYTAAQENFILAIQLEKTFHTLQALLNEKQEFKESDSLPLSEIPLAMSANFNEGWASMLLLLTEQTRQLDRIADCYYLGKLTPQQESRFWIFNIRPHDDPYVGFLLQSVPGSKKRIARVTTPKSCRNGKCQFYNLELNKKLDRSIIMLGYGSLSN